MTIFLIAACIVLGVALIATLVRLRFIKKDIKKMSGKLAEVSQTDTNSRLSTITFDKDISDLTECINLVLAKNRHDYIKVQRMEITLKRAISNISHDLRTPLTSAKGYLLRIKRSKLDEETKLRYLDIVQERLDALTILMDNLFAFTRAVERDITLQRVNVSDILTDILVGSYAEIESKGFVVDANIPDGVYSICDEEALKRVVQNLISNAAQHGNDLLRVSLSDGAGRSPNGELLAHASCAIEIANKTDGLHQIDIHNVFERFYTADTSRTKKRTGLGLAIVKELTEKMGGSVSAVIEDDMLVIRVYFATLAEQ